MRDLSLLFSKSELFFLPEMLFSGSGNKWFWVLKCQLTSLLRYDRFIFTFFKTRTIFLPWFSGYNSRYGNANILAALWFFFPFSKQELFFLLWLFLCLFRFVLAVGVAPTVVTFSRLTAAGYTATTAASAFIPPGIHVDMFGGRHGSCSLRFVRGALFFLLLVLVLHGVFLVIMSVFVGPRTCCCYPGHCCIYCCCDCCCCWRWRWWWWYWVLVLPFSAAGGEDDTLSQ